VPGSGSPAARPAQGSPRAESERARPIGPATSGPPVSTALAPRGPAGPSKPMTALMPPPPAAAAGSGPPASPGAAAPGPGSAQRLCSCREQPARELLVDAGPEPAAAATVITSLDRRTAARRGGLAGLARDTGVLSRICRSTKRGILLSPRCLRGAGRHDERKSERLPRPLPHHTRASHEKSAAIKFWPLRSPWLPNLIDRDR
jgi:hypothetical protein